MNDRQPQERSVDEATKSLLAKAERDQLDTAWDRLDDMSPQCKFGEQGICCRLCNMGPCRIIEGKTETGICGASAATIAARNLVRMIASGAAAHSDHGRDVVETLVRATEDTDDGFQVSDRTKLEKMASLLGVETEGKTEQQVNKSTIKKLQSEFGKQNGNLKLSGWAPQNRIELWKENNLTPRGIDREIVEVMHRTHMGTDTDFKNLIRQGIRCALADGWGGSMIATELQDVLFGTPEPLRAKVNLGVLDSEKVNIVVHGHEPSLSEMVASVAQQSQMKELAREKGAEGVNVTGMCCTANEILMRHGIPVAGNFLQQELALMTRSVDLMMVDVQCIMPALADLSKCFHTKLITTSDKARFPGVEHVAFDVKNPRKTASNLIEIGINNYPNRANSETEIPDVSMDLIGGFTSESVFNFLGGTYRPTYRPLNDAIIDGRLRGAAGIVGCNNPKICHDYGHTELAKELIKNDVLVVSTGCSAIGSGKQGLMKPETAFELAGDGLQEICEAVGLPPVLHVGSCVDNSRILTLLTNMVHEGGLGKDISSLPVAGAAPEWMSEKAVSIAFYFVASGVFTVLGKPFPITGSDKLFQFLTEDIEGLVGGKFAFHEDPKRAAEAMIDHIEAKREKLGLKPVMYSR